MENSGIRYLTAMNINKRDIKLIMSALWDASLWQDSIADAHYRSLMPCARTRENTATAKQADKLRDRYIKLHDRIREEKGKDR